MDNIKSINSNKFSCVTVLNTNNKLKVDDFNKKYKFLLDSFLNKIENENYKPYFINLANEFLTSILNLNSQNINLEILLNLTKNNDNILEITQAFMQCEPLFFHPQTRNTLVSQFQEFQNNLIISICGNSVQKKEIELQVMGQQFYKPNDNVIIYHSTNYMNPDSRTLNLSAINGTEYYEDGHPIVCRHIVHDYIIEHYKLDKNYRNSFAKDTVVFDRIIRSGNQIDSRHFAFLYLTKETIKATQLGPLLKIIAEKKLSLINSKYYGKISTGNHALALKIFHKYQDIYTVELYDPNFDGHFRALIFGLDNIKYISLAAMFMNHSNTLKNYKITNGSIIDVIEYSNQDIENYIKQQHTYMSLPKLANANDIIIEISKIKNINSNDQPYSTEQLYINLLNRFARLVKNNTINEAQINSILSELYKNKTHLLSLLTKNPYYGFYVLVNALSNIKHKASATCLLMKQLLINHDEYDNDLINAINWGFTETISKFLKVVEHLSSSGYLTGQEAVNLILTQQLERRSVRNNSITFANNNMGSSTSITILQEINTTLKNLIILNQISLSELTEILKFHKIEL